MTPIESVGITVVFVGAVIGLVTALVRQLLVSFKVYTSDDPARLDAALAFVSFVLGILLAVGAALDLPAALGILADAAPWFRQLLSGVVVGLGGTAFALGLIKGDQATVQWTQAKAQRAQAEAVHAQAVAESATRRTGEKEVLSPADVRLIIDDHMKSALGSMNSTRG